MIASYSALATTTSGSTSRAFCQPNSSDHSTPNGDGSPVIGWG